MVAGKTHAEHPPPRRRDTGSLGWRAALRGDGNWDLSGEDRDRKKWQIFERGQERFWAVPDVIDWSQPVREDPDKVEAIAGILGFLCPGEKSAVTAAGLIGTQLTSEEGKFYFAEQALEEAKHFDALRRLIPKITGRPLDPVKPSIRMLYTFGVVDRNDVAFMMGNVNLIGEHLANQLFFKVKKHCVDPQVQHLVGRISEDESRHIAAGKRFYPEVYPEFRRNRHRIMAKNLVTLILLGYAGHDMVNPMQKLGIDLDEVLQKMYDHYDDVLRSFPSMPDQIIWDYIMKQVRKQTRVGIPRIGRVTDDRGRVDLKRMLDEAERALKHPRALRRMFT